MSDERDAGNSDGKRKLGWRIVQRIFLLLIVVLVVAAFVGWQLMLEMPGEVFKASCLHRRGRKRRIPETRAACRRLAARACQDSC